MLKLLTISLGGALSVANMEPCGCIKGGIDHA